MAISVAQAYGPGIKWIVTGAVDLDTDAINATLHTSTYTPDPDAHDFYNDATNEVAAGGGYSTGGVALTTKVVTVDGATNQVRFSCDPILFNFTASKTWRHLVLRKARGGASSADELIGYLSWDADQTVSTPYTLTPDTTGLIRFTY